MSESNGTQLNYQNSNYTIPVYEAAGGFDHDAPEGSYRYQGTGTLQRTYQSNSYYTNASGNSNVFLNFGNTFIISNIGPQASTSATIHISFGLYKSKANLSSRPNAFPKLEYAINYDPSNQTGTFSATPILGINDDQGWQLVDAYINIPANATLALRFTNRSNTNGDNSKIQYRIDDLQLEYMDCSTMPSPSIAFTSGGANSCRNQTIALTDANTYSFPVNYAWVNAAAPSTVLSTYSSLTVPSSSAGSANYQVRVSKVYDICPKSASQALNIRPLPSASMSRSVASTCQDNSASITFTGSNGTAPYTFSYTVNGGSTQTTVSAGTTSTVSASTATAQTNTYALQSVQDAYCSANLSSSTDITVLANHAISLSSTTNSDNQTVCIGLPISAITYALSGGATGATVSNLPTGVSASISGSMLTISGSPLSSGIFNYTITTTGNACTVATTTGRITVNTGSAVALSSSDADNTFCQGTAITFTATSGLSNYIFKVNGAVVQSGASNTYTSTSLSTGQSIKVSASSANGCADTSASISNTVYNNPTVTLSSSDADNIICSGTTVTFTANPGLSSYLFQKNGGAVTASSSNNVYSTFSLVQGDAINVIGTNTNGCSAASTSLVHTVNASPNATLTHNQSSTSICAGTAVTFTAGPTGQSNYNFRVNGSSVQSGTLNTYNTSTLTNGQSVDVIVTNAQTCTGNSNVFTFAVTALPSISYVNPQGCAGPGQQALLVYTSTTGNPDSYTLTFDPLAIAAGFSSTPLTGTISGSSGTISIPMGNSSVAGTNYTASLSIRNAATPSQCSVNPNAGTVTISTVSSPTNVTLGSNPSGAICSGTTVVFTAGANGASTYEFKSSGTSLQNSSSQYYTTSSLTNSMPVAVYASNANGCTVASSTISTTVNPLPSIGSFTTSASSAICPGDAVTFTAAGSGGAGSYTYTFKTNGSTKQGPNTTATYTTTTLTNGDATAVTITDANSCSITSSSIVTAVGTNPSAVLSSSDADNTFCTGTSVTFTASSGYSNYNFRINGASVQSSSSNTFTTTSLTNGQYVDAVVTGSGITACNNNTNSITNTVLSPTVTISSSDADNSICTGSSVTFSAATGFSSYSFDVNGVIAQTGTFNTYTTSSLPIGASQIVGVQAISSAGCTTPRTTISTAVVAYPTVTLTRTTPAGSGSFCSGTSATFTATSGLSSYNFRVNGVSKQVGSSNTYTSTTIADGDVVDVIGINSTGCSSTSNTVSNVVETLTPTITFTNPQSCVGQTSASMSYSATVGHPTTYSYTWTSTNAITGLFQNKTAVALPTAPSSITIPIPSGAAAGTYTATLSLNNTCGANPNAGTITLSIGAVPSTPTLTGNPVTGTTICSGTSVTVTSSTGYDRYDFTVAGTTVQSSASNTFTSTTLTNAQQVKVLGVNTSTGCSSAASAAVSYTILPLPDFTLQSVKSYYHNRSVLNLDVDFYRGATTGKLNDEVATSGSGAARIEVVPGTVALKGSYDYYRDGVWYQHKSSGSKNYNDSDWGSITGTPPHLPVGTSYYTISVQCTSNTTPACTAMKSLQILVQDIHVSGTGSDVWVCTNGTRSGATVSGTTTQFSEGNAETNIAANTNSYLGTCGEVFSRENPDGSITQELVNTSDLLAYPNPFTNQLNLRFFVGNAGTTVYTNVTDILGRSVVQLPTQHFESAGVYTMSWDGRDEQGSRLEEGIYLIQMRQNDEVKTVRVVLTR